MSKEKSMLKRGEHRCSLCGRVSAAKSVLRKTTDGKAVVWVCTNRKKCAGKPASPKKAAAEETLKLAALQKAEKKEEVETPKEEKKEELKQKEKERLDMVAKEEVKEEETKPEEEKPKEPAQEEAKPEEKKPPGNTALAEKIRKIREQAKEKQA